LSTVVSLGESAAIALLPWKAKRQISLISEIRLFTRVTVAKSKSVVTNPDEPADPEGGGGFAEWAMLTLHPLRIELAKAYRVAVDLLSILLDVVRVNPLVPTTA